MGKIIGIVAEYNPFHAGHAYQIEKARQMAGEKCTVIAVMSGDFVQRGDWAIQPKTMRAEAACRGGVDAVFELPLPWCLSSAEGFARGAVSLLLSLGITHLTLPASLHRDLKRMSKPAYAPARILLTRRRALSSSGRIPCLRLMISLPWSIS